MRSFTRSTSLSLNISSAWNSTRYVQYLVDTQALGYILNSYCLQNFYNLVIPKGPGVFLWVND